MVEAGWSDKTIPFFVQGFSAKFQGSRSAIRLAGWSGNRAKTSASHARGSISLSLAVSINV
jgi:hypothetical protein